MFCNAFLTDTTLWSFLLPHILAPPRSYNVLLYDQRGHGKSSVPSTTSTDTAAQDIARILEFLSISNVHAVIGAADGGIVALSFATQFPDIAKNVVVCGTPLSLDLNLKNNVVPRWFPSGSSLSEPRKEIMQAMVEGVKTEEPMVGLTGYYDSLSDGVAACKTRLMLVAGGLDDGIEGLKQQHGDRVSFETIPDAGRLPMVDATEAFWTVLKGFLE